MWIDGKPQFMEDLDWEHMSQDDIKRVADAFKKDKKAFLSKFANPEWAASEIQKGFDDAAVEDIQKELDAESDKPESENDLFMERLIREKAPSHVIRFWYGMLKYGEELKRNDKIHFTIKPGMDEKLNKVVELLDAEYGNGLREFMEPEPKGDPNNVFSWRKDDDPVTESDIGEIRRQKVVGSINEDIVVLINGNGIEISPDDIDGIKNIVGDALTPELFVSFADGKTTLTFRFYDVYDQH